MIPAILGRASAGYLTNATALSIDRIPTSLVVIGAGYVGLELGQMFAQLGSRVTVLKRGPQLLGDYEPEVGESLGAALARVRVQVTCVSLSLVHRGVVNRETDRVFVIVADGASRRILGAQIVSGNAGDATYAAALAVKCGLTVDNLVGSFAPYLTMTEGVRIAAVAFDRDSSKLSCSLKPGRAPWRDCSLGVARRCSANAATSAFRARFTLRKVVCPWCSHFCVGGRWMDAGPTPQTSSEALCVWPASPLSCTGHGRSSTSRAGTLRRWRLCPTRATRT